MVSFNDAINNVNSLPNRMVTLSKINFTESLPIAYYDRIARMEGVAVATHMNWFGGYYQEPRRGFMPVFAVDPETYFQVYDEDLADPADAARRVLHRTHGACSSPSRWPNGGAGAWASAFR